MSGAYTHELGVIGVGAMGGALVRGLVQQGTVAPGAILVTDVAAAKAEVLHRDLGVGLAASPAEVVRGAQIVLLAVKPQGLPELLADLYGSFRREQLVVSIAAGVTLRRLRELIGQGIPLVRVMPNLLCTVRASATAYAVSPEVSGEAVARVDRLLESVGLALPVEEKLMDAVTGLAGSGPAFAAVFCEALADGGVAAGLPRQVALELAAQVLLGTGKWVREHGSAAALKDQVTSPGGTTIAGLQKLESGGLRSAALEAVVAAARRSAELGQGSAPGKG